MGVVGLDERLLRAARAAAGEWLEAVGRAEVAKVGYHRAVRHLHLAGGSMREIAEALELSHQRVHQMVEEAGGTAGWKPWRKEGADLACSFCGAARTEVGKLVAGPGVYICDSCVVLCGREVREGDGFSSHLDVVPPDSAFTCSFCGRAAADAGRLVAGPGVKICDQCVEFCAEVISTSAG